MTAQQFKLVGLKREETDRLLRAIRTPKEEFVVVILLHTGLRPSELSNLKQESLLDHRTLEVHGKSRGTHLSKRREVPLSPPATKLLAEFFARSTPPLPRRTIHHVVQRVGQRAGLRPVNPRILRHTFALEAIRKGVPLNAIQKILGHEHLGTTSIYLEMHPEEAHAEFRRRHAWAKLPEMRGTP